MRRRCLLGLLLIILLPLLSCGPAAPPLRIAINAWPGYEFVYLAEQQGIFDRLGVDVEVVEFESLSDARRAFERGQVDGFGCTAVEALISAASGTRKVAIPYVADYSNGADLIVARGDPESVADLVGRKIAVEAGTLNSYILARALERAGKSLSDIQLVKMPQSRMAMALQEGYIDAAVTYPPFSLAMLDIPDTRIVFDTRQIPGEIIDVLVFDHQVIRQRKREVTAVLRGIEQAIVYAKAQPEVAYPIMAAREGMALGEFERIIENEIIVMRDSHQTLYLRDGRLLKIMKENAEVLRQTGELSTPIDLESIPVWIHDSP